MNKSVFFLKIVEEPLQDYCYQNDNSFLKIRAEFSYFVKEKLIVENVNLIIWGRNRTDVLNYFRKDDYVIIEGIIRTYSETDKNNLKFKQKRIEIVVLEIYLIFLIL